MVLVKRLLLLLALLAIAGGSYFFANYEIQPQRENGKVTYWKIVAKGTPAPAAKPGSPAPAASPGPVKPTFRIATFDLGRLDDAKLASPRANHVLVNLLPQFELTALQGIRGKNRGVLIRLVEQLNAATGRTFDFATCPTQQRDAIEHYSAFLFDTASIEVDRTTVYFIEDPLNRFRTKPLVGEFRARGPDPAEAFTFSLINVETDPDRAAAEVDLLAEVYRAVRDHQPNEDDIIMLGDFERDDSHLGRLNGLLGVAPLVSGVPTTVRGTHLLDNILLDRNATREFTGRVEVVDLLRVMEMTAPEAAEISEHLPVWAEFSVYEGGQAGHAQAAAPK